MTGRVPPFINGIYVRKVDQITKEMFALSYGIVKKPYFRYFLFAADGEKSLDVEVEIPDFTITEDHVIIPDQQVVFKLEEMVRELKWEVGEEERRKREKWVFTGGFSKCRAIALLWSGFAFFKN
ncbi:hypothetical protein QJS10_CPB15g00135 [Acorus calamus]|uniref:Uncharacterized protein n=1 Tax=Acorus calamus TaxID=4465 RepID=A0AAV9D751_ACOCL|nr:hypothetical protein QJS10_CPB15g00135 [Acorus calamus]